MSVIGKKEGQGQFDSHTPGTGVNPGFQSGSNSVLSPGARAAGTLQVLWTADERLSSPYRWRYFYRMDTSSAARPALETEVNRDHDHIVTEATRLGFVSVPKRQRELHLRWVAQLDAISRVSIDGRPLRELLRFEGISLWQFLPECCYLGSAPELQETIELIDYLSDLIERYRPSRLVLIAPWKDHQKAVVSLIAQRYEVSVECYSLQTTSKTLQARSPQPPPDDRNRRLEEGQPSAVRQYLSMLRNAGSVPSAGDNTVLLLSFPRAWTCTIDGGRFDSYYEPFRSFFQERGLSPIRVELPYYFQIEGGIQSYIDLVIRSGSDSWPTIFLDESGSDSLDAFARKCRIGLHQLFEGIIRNPEFHAALSWRGIGLVSPLLSFWQRLFVDHIALRCIPAMMMARRLLETVRPRAILAVYEVGLYARAMIIEAHRLGIPSLGLQHAYIHPEHEYYLHEDVVYPTDLTKGCDGRIIPTKTLLFGPDAQRILTQCGRYPIQATEVVGCDWRWIGHDPVRVQRIQELRKTWFPSGRKIALVISQPSLTYGTLNQLIQQVAASEFAVLIKLHPDDKAGDDYRCLLEEHGFEVRIIRNCLRESIQAADWVFASAYSTAGLESLCQGKPVFTVRDLELPYSTPWDRFTINLSGNEAGRIVETDPKSAADLESALKVLGYDRSVTWKDFNLRLHSIFDEWNIKCRDTNTSDATTARVQGEAESSSIYRNDLYRNSQVNYDTFFPKTIPFDPTKTDGLLIRQVQRISFQLSNLCNYASVHTRCPLHGQTDKQVLPSRVVRATIDELASIKFDGVIAFHIYNEPMIDPRLFCFIDYTRRVCPSARILILTNGFYLTQTTADDLGELGIWNLVVSAYSQSEFDRLSGLDVKVPYKVFLARLDGRLDQYDRPPIHLRKPCWAPIRDLSIGPDASVILCCLDWKQRHVFGNLMQETLSSILNKESIRSVYRDLLGGNRSLHLCQRCDWVR